jgi:phage baseplate assembly protein V
MSFDVTELDRRLSNLIRFGKISQVNYGVAKVRVEVGDFTTGWLPWLTQRAGGDRCWHAPEVGEQVVILSPSGELNQGVVLAGLFQTAYPANSNSADIHRIDYGNGDYIEHNRATGNLAINMSGDVNITATGNVNIAGANINLN